MSDLIKKKISARIESSAFGKAKAGKLAAAFLNEEKWEEKSYEGLNSVVAETKHSYFRRRVILIALAVNVLSWASLVLLPTVVSRLVFAAGLIFSKGGALLALPAFSATLIGVYALFRIWFPDREDRLQNEAGLMQSYHRQLESLKTWRIWLVAGGAAAINALGLVAVYFYLTGEWHRYLQ